MSLTKALFALEKPWRLGTPLLPSMLTITLSRFQTSTVFFLNHSYLRDGPLEKWWEGWGKKQKKIHARENAEKKNSCRDCPKNEHLAEKRSFEGKWLLFKNLTRRKVVSVSGKNEIISIVTARVEKEITSLKHRMCKVWSTWRIYLEGRLLVNLLAPLLNCGRGRYCQRRNSLRWNSCKGRLIGILLC